MSVPTGTAHSGTVGADRLPSWPIPTDAAEVADYHRRMNTLPPQLLSTPLPADPLGVAAAWLQEAWALSAQPNPNSMTLATVDAHGRPSARIVLCKDIQVASGYVRFVSNYDSRKGQELAQSPRAAVVLHWDHLHRQVRLEGIVVKSPVDESDEYFASRPWQSRVGAWASAQSRPVDSRDTLVAQLRDAGARFGTPPVGPDAVAGDAAVDIAVPRPPNWGGYRLWVDAVELWVEGPYRIHDRARYERTLTAEATGGFSASAWQVSRLQP